MRRPLDRVLARFGLVRLSAVPRIEVLVRAEAPNYVKIEFPTGHRVSGYLDAGLNPLIHADHPLVHLVPRKWAE